MASRFCFCYHARMPILLYNSLTRSLENFEPLRRDLVGVYTCGPTVYGTSHIGNFRAFLFADILVRVLRYNGHRVKWVMNITDVGHLTDDADQGEDKMEVGSKREGKSAWDIAREYTDEFLLDMDRLHIVRPDVLPRATGHIAEQIALIQELEANGYTYATSDGVYFDTSKLADYGSLAGQAIEEKEEGARVEINREKRHASDFALWKLSVPRNAHPEQREGSSKRQMEWESPWGLGFPGWHIECTAMSMKELGELYYIHTGGTDHKMVHHPNEIAQAQGSKGTTEARVWMHNEFLQVDGGKMSKSLGNVYTTENVMERGFDPMAFRYLTLTAHYRNHLNFTWESLAAAANALTKLRQTVREWEMPSIGCAEYDARFLEAINHDLDTPKALAIVWELVNDAKQPTSAKAQSLKKWDAVLGLGLMDYIARPLMVPEHVQKLVQDREAARVERDFATSDRLRDEIKKAGFAVEDTSAGSRLTETG